MEKFVVHKNQEYCTAVLLCILGIGAWVGKLFDIVLLVNSKS